MGAEGAGGGAEGAGCVEGEKADTATWRGGGCFVASRSSCFLEGARLLEDSEMHDGAMPTRRGRLPI